MLYLLEKLTWIHYILIVFFGSVVGTLLCEVLSRFSDGIRNVVEEIEKQDGLKRVAIGGAVAFLPMFLRIGIRLMGVYEPMMKWFTVAQWPLYIFFACYLLGAVLLIVGLAMFVLSIRHG